jgi:glycosyltransferase involved in cell wall biosynthesis
VNLGNDLKRGRVSVIVPTYNRADLLSQTIESILEQSYSDVEIVVIDDGSVDRTDVVLAGYDGRIKLKKQPNAGLSAARNEGLRLCSGEFIVFLDSDDLLLPGKIESQVGYLRTHESVDVVYSDGYIMKQDGTLHPLDPFVVRFPPERWTDLAELLLSRNLFAVHTAMVRRHALPVDGPFDTELRALEDWDLWLRLALKGVTFSYQDEKTVVYRRHSGNMGADDSNVFTKPGRRMILKVVDQNLDISLSPETRRRFRFEHLDLLLREGSLRTLLQLIRVLFFPDAEITVRAAAQTVTKLLRPGSAEQATAYALLNAVVRASVPKRIKLHMRNLRILPSHSDS